MAQRRRRLSARSPERVGEAFARRPELPWATGRCLIVDREGREIRRAVTAYKDLLLRRWSYGLYLTPNFVSCPPPPSCAAAPSRVWASWTSASPTPWTTTCSLRLGRLAPPEVIDAPLAAFRMAEGSLSTSGFERQFAEHLQNAREHGRGHPVAVGANALLSRAIVLAYRGLRRARTRGGTR